MSHSLRSKMRPLELLALVLGALAGCGAAPPGSAATPSETTPSATTPSVVSSLTSSRAATLGPATVTPSVVEGGNIDDDVAGTTKSEAMRLYWQSVERAMEDGSAEQQGMLQEGDILSMPPGLRNADADPNSKWPNREVVVEFAPHEWRPQDLAVVLDALRDVERESCVRFVRRTNQTDYLLLKHTGHSCASGVGYQEGVGAVPVFLGGPACLRKGTIQHEILHTLGMWHEHTRPDRDQHVTILWGNIAAGRKANFLRRPPGTVRTLGLPYDYGSVMHYRAVAFSSNGRPTIVPKVVEGFPLMGQRRRFSRLDIAKLNTLYECPAPYYRKENVYLDNVLVNFIDDSFPKRNQPSNTAR